MEVMRVIRLYTPEEVAEILAVKESTVRHWMRSGTMPGIKIGKFWRIPEEALKKYLENKAREIELVGR
jgi:acetyl-CoA synthetase